MNREILKLAIPNILANLSVPVVSMVDVALMGHLGSGSYILAIGFGVMIFNFMYWAFGFLRMGMTGMTAQEVGRKNVPESYRLLFRGLLIAFGGALLLILFQTPLLNLALYAIDGSDAVNQQVSDYFRIRIYAAPATIGLYAFVGWFLGKQNATIPMIITILVNFLNAGLSYYLVTAGGMETEGVALGTVVAQYTGFVVAVLFFLGYYRQELTREAFQNIVEIQAMKRFILVNTDILIRTLCLIFALSFFKVMSARESELIGAANILLLEFIAIAAYGIDGFAYAAESISGKYFGAGDPTRLRQAIRYCFYWGFGLGLLYGLAYWLFGFEILSVLTDQQQVIQVAMDYLIWLIIFPLVSVIPFVWDGVYIGLTSSKAMRNTMLLATIIFIGAFYGFEHLFGNHGVWLAMITFVLARGISQTILAKRVVYDKLIKR
ncbi:MAG: MATE family efflux transporter [Flavobacteriales bacterium]|nr:MATE family efflux transporter [Flavobacteriales bacterium]